MTLIKELIDIPERIQQGDFVLKLSEGVNDADVTLRDYVVTPELVNHFDDALTFIKSALEGNASKATYLHGSFGSGKSHFMAVLHLILQGNAKARAIPELAPVITKHNHWIDGKKFLLVPYHAISSNDMESLILGGYVNFIRRHHENAPIPGVYLAEGLFRDAQNMRETMGDEAFFEKLNQGVSEDSGWGKIDDNWDAEQFETAIVADPGSEARSRLISQLVKNFFSSYDQQASGQGEAFLSLDEGLSVISRHAQSLGYDALILFLDELILWLASRAADLRFLHQEGQKLAKLVEAQNRDRPIPVISFVARQRDLSDLVGDAVPGAERLNFSDALKHWEGRFHRITLEDRNLPIIAEKRVLKCKSETAKQELNAEFEKTKGIREAVMNTLLTREGDRETFRRVYPFSLALVQTLIAVSSLLQRERTALKIMMQLLVEQQDTLKLGDIVPVGDLFDLIAHGEEAFSREMAIHFDNAKRLYHQKLLPLLEKQHGLRKEDLPNLPEQDSRKSNFHNDDRLIKTLLLSALVPEVESLRGLNAERLAALNHGTIKSPIPGREGSMVLSKCKQWAASVGEIRISDDINNPTISLQLSSVDTDRIIKQAEQEDNRGNRVRLLKQMLFQQLDIKGEDQFEQYRDFLWRNTKRSCGVLFTNIRELPDASLENSTEDWKLIIDYPFDDAGHTPRDDGSKIQSFKTNHSEGTKTLCWLPSFFSEDAEKDLGKLVILEHILTGDRFNNYANDLSLQDRQTAKSLLENQRSILRNHVQKHLEVAYGIQPDRFNSVNPTHALETNEQFVSLQPGLELKPPVAANLLGAVENLLDQALQYEFPAAPTFGVEIKRNSLEKVYAVIRDAVQTPDGRVEVDKALRSLIRQIANPLRLGEIKQDATHFVLGQYWKNHFNRKSAEVGGSITVSQLRQWIEQPQPMGLPKEAQNLVILTYAEQTNQGFYLHARPYDDISIKDIPNLCQLKAQQLPDETDWNLALERANDIFGLSLSPLRNASNVEILQSKVQEKAVELQLDCQRYTKELQERLVQFSLSEKCDRAQTASAISTLVDTLCSVEPETIIKTLANATIQTSASAMQDCLSNVKRLRERLENTKWELFDGVSQLTDQRQAEAEIIRREIEQALQNDEYVVALSPTLRKVEAEALRLLTQSQPSPTPPPGQPVLPKPGKRTVQRSSQADLDPAAAQKLVTDLEKNLEKGQQIRFTLSWNIEEDTVN